MGGGSGGGNTTTTQKADPWSGVQPYLTQGYQQLANLYAPGVQPHYANVDSGVAPQDQATLQANQYLQSRLGSMAQLGDAAGTSNIAMGQSAAGGAQTGLGAATAAMNGLQAAGDPANNPYFQSTLDAAIRPVTQNFQEQVLPSITQGAQDAGQMGSSRQGIAEGLASRGYTDSIGDIATNMGNQAYAQGLQAQQAAGQLGSSIYGAGLTGLGQSQALAGAAQGALAGPATALGGIGAANQQQAQSVLTDNINRWNDQQNLPYTMISDYLGLLNGASGGQTVSSQSGGGTSKVTGALGGAATGAAIGSVVPGIGTGIGAGVGALYGLFM